MKKEKLLFVASFVSITCALTAIIGFRESPLIFYCGILLALLAILVWSFYFPYIILIILIALCYDLFGFVPVMEKLRLDWAWGATPPDLLLVLMFIPTTLRILEKRFIADSILYSRKLIMMNFLIVGYTIFLVFYSSFLTDRSPFDYALRIGGGHLLYYSIFMITMYLVTLEKHVLNIINFIRGAALLTAILSISSNLIQRPIIPVLSSYYGTILRVNLPGYAFSVFVIIFGYINYVLKPKEIRISLFEILINLLGFLLFLGRMWIVSLTLMLIVSAYFLNRISIRKALVFCIGLILVYQVSVYFLGDINPYFVQRMKSGYQETVIGEGSLVDRFRQIEAGYEVFRETPIFGTGFVREGSPFYDDKIAGYGFAATYSADFGLASILFTTGLLGFSLITGFIVMAIRKMMHVFRDSRDLLVSNVAIAVSILVGFDYFLTQLVGNFFGTKWVSFYLVLVGLALALPYASKDRD